MLLSFTEKEGGGVMEYNVHHISSQHDFAISGVSYIGNPKSHTAMFVTKKVEYLLNNMDGCFNCLIFVEKGISVPPYILNCNCIVFSDNPQREYAKFVNDLYNEYVIEERRRRYTQTQEGYYVGENVIIGKNAYIEPACFIGHNVLIGNNACILSGAVIKKSSIGDDILVGENAVIGAMGFTMTEDENGNKLRMPTLGNVCIGNNVEIGVHDNISCGSGGDTIIEDFVKLDALVHIGHDVYLGKNVEITAGSVIGGFTRLENNAYIGVNASVRNRINIGQNSIVGMGATVTRSVEPNITVVGNPARLFAEKKEC